MHDEHLLYPWLQASSLQLAAYINQQRIPQALLITGKKGLGKFALAEHYAQTLLCSSAANKPGFCGECQTCKLYLAETHPDYIVIKPEGTGKSITISVIRDLVKNLQLKPQFEAYRVVIIDQADRLNNASSNAFLKYLEEPTERTCLILITDQPAKLTATIRSRCQTLHIPRVDKNVSDQWLKQQGIKENNKLLLQLSQGAPLQAKYYADNDLLMLRSEWFSHWQKFTRTEISLVALAEQWNKLELHQSEQILLWLISWVSDMIKLANLSQQNKLCNTDLIIFLQEWIEELKLKHLFDYYDFLLLCQQRLTLSINKQLMFEEILIKWSMLNRI